MNWHHIKHYLLSFSAFGKLNEYMPELPKDKYGEFECWCCGSKAVRFEETTLNKYCLNCAIKKVMLKNEE